MLLSVIVGCGGDEHRSSRPDRFPMAEQKAVSRTVAQFLSAAGQGDDAAKCALVSEEFLTVESETPGPCPDPESPSEASPEANVTRPAAISTLGMAPALVTVDIGSSDGGAIFIVDGSRVVGVLQHQSDAGNDPGVYTTDELPAGDTKMLVADTRPQVKAVGLLLAGLAAGQARAVCQHATGDAVIQLIDLYQFVNDEDYPTSRPVCAQVVAAAISAARGESTGFTDAGRARLRGFGEPDGIARADLVRTAPPSEKPERDWFGSVFWVKRTRAGWRIMGLGRTNSSALNAFNPGS